MNRMVCLPAAALAVMIGQLRAGRDGCQFSVVDLQLTTENSELTPVPLPLLYLGYGSQ